MKLDFFEASRVPAADLDLCVARATALAVQSCAPGVGGALALAVAAQAAAVLLTPEVTRRLSFEVEQEHRRHFGAPVSDEAVSGAWRKACALAGERRPDPLVFESREPSPMVLIDRLYFPANCREKFTNEGLLMFTMGHEIGHLERGDSLGGVGLALLSECLDSVMESSSLDRQIALNHLGQVLHQSYRERSHQEEFAADRRGLEIMRAAGHDPRIALDFLSAQVGSADHPDGLLRARALEKFL